jgi:WD40 repeat protein/serine/threonine protein kinase
MVMAESSNRQKEIFLSALDLCGDERAAFLAQACGADITLRRDVEAMLQSDAVPDDSFLEKPADATLSYEPITERLGTLIGPYKLLQQIGEGGMGVVFMAEQEKPVRRMVALKIIKPGMDSRQVIARFESERQALAMMDHPNIARVLDAGATDSGRPFFVMELVKGIPITKFCDENQLTPRQRLELFATVCQAVQHAHQKGIIHRDLKPSNVLIAMYDNKPVPKVIDFGVAKATSQKLTERTLFTEFGSILGTLEYMSPEQAKLNALDIDTRSDVYALGVLLYELLTGTTPLEKNRLRELGYEEMLRLIREVEAPKPSMRLSSTIQAGPAMSPQRKTAAEQLTKLLRGELDWIVLKALEKDRARRYDTASAFARDIERYLKDEPVEACPPSLGYRLQKYARKHKTALAMAGMAAALLLSGIAATSWQAVRAIRAEREALIELGNAEKARRGEAEQRFIAVAAAAEAKTNEQKAKEAGDEALRLAEKEKSARKLADGERLKADFEKQQADVARQKAEDNENKAEWRLYASHIASAQRQWQTDNVPLLYHYLDLSRKAFRGWEHDYLYTLANRYQQTLAGPAKHRYRLAFSPDDKRLAIAGAGPSFDKDATDVQLWDLARDKVVLTLKDTWGHVAFNPDGTRLASSWDHTDRGNAADGFRIKTEGRVKVWDVVSGKEIFSLNGHAGKIYSVAFSPDGKRLASASSDGVKLWDMDNGNEFKGVRLPVGVGLVAFSPAGKQFASAGPEGIKVWDMSSGKAIMTFEHADHIWNVAFSPDGKRLAATFLSGGNVRVGSVKVWDLTTGKEVFAFKGRAGPLFLTADGKRFFSASEGEVNSSAQTDTVKAWDLASGQEVLTLRGPSGPVAVSHDGKRLASVSSDGVRVWDLVNSQDCLTLTGNKSVARGLAFSPDSKHLAGLSSDFTVKLWEAASGRQIRTFKGHTDLVTSVAFSPNGKTLASSSWDKTVKLWDAASGKEILTLPGHTNKVERVAFSPDGNHLASAEQNWIGSATENSVRVWELPSGKVVLTIKGTGPVAFSPDGKSLATTSGEIGNKIVKVFDAVSGMEIMAGKGHTGSIRSVAFSPDGKRLASASRDGTVKMWDLASGQEIMTLKDHRSQVLSVAFSPDGKRLASGSDDNTVKIWDAATGHEVITLKGHAAAVPCVTFSPDGKRLASASSDFTIKIWDASKSMPERQK